MAIHESGEDYLEAILMIKERNGNVRSIDVAHELSFSKPSVSVAMKHLRERNHITVTDAGFIYLTEEGRSIAEMIYERHEMIIDFLEKLGVPKEIAAEDACRIEHVISAESFTALKKHILSIQ